MLVEDGDSDLADLATYIIVPVVTNGGEIQSNSTPGQGVFRNVDALNVYTVLTDGGDDEIAQITDFSVEYVGVQYRKLSNRLTLDDLKEEALITIDTIHIFRAALGELLPADMMWHMTLNVQDPATGYEEEITDVLVDTEWFGTGTGTSVRYQRLLGTPNDNPYQILHWYRMRDQWSGVSWLISQMLGMYTGLDGLSCTLDTPSAFPNVEGTGAMSMWYLHKQFSITGEPGAAITAQDVWFLGSITLSDSPNTMVGGWLYPGETDLGLYRYDTLWNWFVDICAQCCCRVLMEQDYFGSITLKFVALDDDSSSSITKADLKNPTYNLLLWDELIAGADSDVVGAFDGDIPNAEYTAWGSSEDERRTVPTVFHNRPVMGDINDRTFYSDPVESHLYAISDDIPPNIMAYIVSGVAYRVHHHVGIRHADGTIQYDTISAPTNPYPDPGELRGEPDDVIIEQFWGPWRSISEQLQKRGGVSYAACAFIAKMFSRWTQYSLEDEVDYQLALLDSLGKRITLDPSTIMANGDYLSTLPANPIITSISMNDEDGTAKIKLIGVE